jgi:hypothetical protein
MILIKSFLVIFILLIIAFLYKKYNPAKITDPYIKDYVEGFEGEAEPSGAGPSGAEPSSADPDKTQIVKKLDTQLKELLKLQDQAIQINEGFRNYKI